MGRAIKLDAYGPFAISTIRCTPCSVAGPGHGGPALVRNTYLEGSYSDRPPPARHPATIAFTIHMPVGGVPSGAVARAVP